MVVTIRDTLREIDPEHAGIYENAADYIENSACSMFNTKKLWVSAIWTRSSPLTARSIIFAARYGFEVRSIAGLSPEDEPSSRDLAELTKLIRKKYQIVF